MISNDRAIKALWQAFRLVPGRSVSLRSIRYLLTAGPHSNFPIEYGTIAEEHR